MQQQAPHTKERTKLPSQARATFDTEIGAQPIRKELKLAPITLWGAVHA